MSYLFVGRFFDKYRRFFPYEYKDYFFKVNLQNGELYLTRKLIEFSGKHLPLSLSLKYSQQHVNVYDNLHTYTGFPIGFKTNYHVVLEYDSNYDEYVYEDMDGFKHIFKLALYSSTLYFDTKGSGLMLEATATGHKVFDDDGNYQEFDSNGRLIKIHKQVTSTHYAEQTITYLSDLKISSITDGQGRTISFSYTSSSIQISYGNNVAITLCINSNLLTKISKNIGGNHIVEDTFSQSNYLTSIILSSGETFSFSYTNDEIDHFNTNIGQDAFSFSYDPSGEKWAVVTTANGIATRYDFQKHDLLLQKTDTNTSTDLGFFRVNSNIISCMVKPQETSNEIIDFEFENNQFSINTNSNSSGYSAYMTNNYLEPKRMYLLVAEIYGNLAQDTFEIQLFDYDGDILAELVFRGSNKILSFPVGICYGVQKSFRLYYKNNCPNSVEIVKARLVPLIGDFELMTTQIPSSGPTFFYDSESYYVLSGREVRSVNGNQIAHLGYKMEPSDLIRNERLFYKRNGSFRFWCNDQTQLIDGCTRVVYSADFYDYVVFDSQSEKISYYVHYSGDTYTYGFDAEFYRIKGKDDNSISITKISHDSSVFSTGHTSSYYEEEEIRVNADNENVTYFDYDDNYNSTDVNRDDGYQETYTYDSNGNLETQEISHSSINDSIFSELTYDSNDNLISEEKLVDDSVEETTYDYDNFGNLSKIEYPNTHRIRFDYDNVTGERELDVAYGNTNQDAFLQNKNYIDGDNYSYSVEGTSYVFNYSDGRLISVSYNNQQILSITYYQTTTSSGAVITNSETLTYSNGGSIYTEYDSYGRLYIKGICLYCYDDYSNLLAITDGYYHQNHPAISYSYNYQNQVVGIGQYNHLNGTFEYDAYKRLTSQAFYYNSVSPLYSIDYTYYDKPDLENAIKKSLVTYDSSTVEAIDETDAFSRLTSQKIKFGSKFLKQEIEYCSYQGGTNRLIKTVTHSDETTYPGPPVHFNPALFTNPIIDTYTYDGVGNILSIVKRQLTFTLESVSYEYDVHSRLTRENCKKLSKTITYEYDNKGNITSKKEYAYTAPNQTPSNPIATHTYTYSSTYPDRLTNYDNETFAYDTVGNPTTYRGKSMCWTRGTLLSQYYNGSAYVNLTYDGLNQRVVKTVGNDFTEYKYINNILVVEERGNKSITYLYSHRGVIGFILNGYNNQSLNIDGVYFYEKNLQLDVVSIRNTNNDIVAKYVYDAWGNHEVRNPDDSINTNSTFIGNINPIRYRSYYYDSDLKMYWLTTRYYDPEIGRFISPDHYSYLDYQKLHGINLYAYSKNNPVMYYDPTGHFLWAIILAIRVIKIATIVTAATDLGHEIGASLTTKTPPTQDEIIEEGYVSTTINGVDYWYAVKGYDENHPEKTILKVANSWQFTRKEIRAFLEWLSQQYEGVNILRIENEWKWHNIAFSLGIAQDSTKSVDAYFNAPDKRFWFIFDIFKLL